jgi:Spy/CpxP family protein refolding chaperone
MGLPYDPMTDPKRPQAVRPRDRRFPLARAALLTIVILAIAAVAGARGMWRGHHDDPDLARDHAAFMVERLLSRVDATPEQVTQVQSIVDDTLGDLFELREAGDWSPHDLAEVLTAEEIDRPALEALRRQKLAAIDTASMRIVTSLADISEVLTPAQREAVAQRLAEHREHGRHGWRH